MPEMPKSETQEVQGKDVVRLPAPRKKICKWDGFCFHYQACKCGQEIPHSNIA